MFLTMYIIISVFFFNPAEIAEGASKEFSIETATKTMQKEWVDIGFDHMPYRCDECYNEIQCSLSLSILSRVICDCGCTLEELSLLVLFYCIRGSYFTFRFSMYLFIW